MRGKSWWVRTFAAVCFLFATWPAEAVSNNAIVRAVRDGVAEFSKDGGKTWKPVKIGSVLMANFIVRTDANATADLFLGNNGPVVRVTKATTLAIDRLEVENTGIEKVIDTQLDLKSGTILGNVKKMAAASKYEVKTPVGVAGIRGTEFSISANGAIRVFSGTVVVVYIVNGPMQGPITLTAGMEIGPASLNGGASPIAQITSVPDSISIMMAGVTTEPDGTISVTLADGRTFRTTPSGKTIGPEEIIIIGRGDPVINPEPPRREANFDTASGTNALVVVVNRDIQTGVANPGGDITNTPLTETEPGMGVGAFSSGLFTQTEIVRGKVVPLLPDL